MEHNSQREQSLFEAALEITNLAERQAFLDQACGDDHALRNRIERLLGLLQNAETFFTGCAPALEVAASEAGPSQIPSAAKSALKAEPEPGSRIGPYKLLQKLGEGGCGVVFMAEQERPVRRRVALKIIKLGMDTKSVIARFEAERQALALMDHPNIAGILDAGATETGRPYFVMELVYGVKITEFCDENRLGMAERLNLFVEVCHAVQHAHQKGIIHRDLKPSNIMVTMRDGVPVPKVIDFGIAKATGQSLTDKTLFTGYAQLIGTPTYMSPEQMEFSSLNLDTRSDIYSLGVLLYELLTGRTPFDTTELLKSGVDELKRTIREKDPPSPSAKLRTLGNEELTKTARMRRVEPPRLLHQLHGDLDWIVMKCLEKDRTRRYETVNGLAMDIQRYLRQEPVLARPPSQWYRMQKLVRRHRLVFLSGAAVSAALLLGTVISTSLFFKEREARRSEERLRKEAEVRAEASHVASLLAQRRFEEADKLLANIPLDQPSIEAATGLRALGGWLATNGRWQEAAEKFGLLVKVDQFDGPDLIFADQLKLAAALLKAGDRRAYEQFRRSAVAKSAPTNASTEYSLIKLVLVEPPDSNLLHSIVRLAEVGEKKFPTPEDMRPYPSRGGQWSEALALLEYRRGRFPQALDWCSRCESYPLQSGASMSTTSLIRAMSNWRSGQYQSAVVDWTEAYELIQAKSQQGLDVGVAPSALFPGALQPEERESSWQDWVMASLLLRECDELIAQSERSLDTLSGAKPVSEDPAKIRALGEWHAIRGEWEQARKRFEYVQQSDQGGTAIDYLHSAVTALEQGDEAGFSRLRDQALTRFKGATDAWTAEYVMKTVLLRPAGDSITAAVEPFAQVLGFSASSANSIKAGTTTPSSMDNMLFGLLEYRRGNYAGALDWCQRSLDAPNFIALPAATDRIIRAMSFHRLGNDAAARSELGQASSLVQGGFNIGFDQWNWREWATYHLMFREAEAMMPQASVSASSSATAR